MNRYGYDFGFRPGPSYQGGSPRMRGYDAEVAGRFGRGAAWDRFRRMNHLERDERVPERIARAAREGRTGYGGYPGPRRSPSAGRYDLQLQRGYDRRW